MTTDQLIERISRASKSKDWAAVRRNLQELERLMSNEGRPVPPGGAYKLVEALSQASAPGTSTRSDPYKLKQQLDEALNDKRDDKGAVTQAWEALNQLLSNPTIPFDPDLIHEVLASLRKHRQFDLLAKTSERAVMRDPDDAFARCLYGQALIDSQQMHAGIEVLNTISAANTAPRVALDEANGLKGRANKQIYVDNVKSSTTPSAVRRGFKPYLQEAINSYASAFHPERAAHNQWHGVNLIALLVLAREDGHIDIENPTQMPPEEIAQKLIAVLEPQAELCADAWVLASIGEAYLALRDYDKAAEFFGLYVRHPDIDAFKLGGTIRQLEQVWRLKPATGGAGPILAILKEAEIGKDEGRFTLPVDSFDDIQKFAQSQEHAAYRESMVPGGEFVKLADIQVVVARAAAVAAIRDRRSDRTMGTGFLIRGAQLHESLGNEIFILTNAHVVSDPDKPGYEPRTLHPADISVVLEGAGHKRLESVPEVVWQSPIAEHDAALIRVTSDIGRVEPLELAPQSMPLIAEDQEARQEGSRVSVIGYPLGGPLSLSQVGNVLGANGILVDIGTRRAGDTDPIYIHYRAPTEPGNSGSPVFETDDWRVIGLHHMGFNQFEGRPKLGGKPGNSFANEGIEIRSIQKALSAHLKSARRRTIFG